MSEVIWRTDSALQISGKSRTSFRLLTNKPHYSQVYLSNFSLPAIITPSYQPCTHLCTSHLPPTICTCQTMLKCCSFLLKKSDILIVLKGFLSYSWLSLSQKNFTTVRVNDVWIDHKMSHWGANLQVSDSLV